MASSNVNKFITPKELASYLSVSEVTVRRLIDGRQIAFYKIRGSIRLKIGDVDKYITSIRIEPITKNYECKKT